MRIAAVAKRSILIAACLLALWAAASPASAATVTKTWSFAADAEGLADAGADSQVDFVFGAAQDREVLVLGANSPDVRQLRDAHDQSHAVALTLLGFLCLFAHQQLDGVRPRGSKRSTIRFLVSELRSDYTEYTRSARLLKSRT